MERSLRHLSRSLDASQGALDRTLSRDPHQQQGETELWARTRSRRSTPHLRRFGLLLLALSLAAVASVMYARRPQKQMLPARAATSGREAPTSSVAKAPAPAPPGAPAATPATEPPPPPGDLAVIHVRAIRPCAVRLAVDEISLPWRRLQTGDELFSRPRRQLRIETDDWGAISATLNGRPVSLGPDENVIRVR